MRFGGRQLPLSQRFGRMLIYFQCGMLGLAALFALAATGLSGPGSGLSLSGLLLAPSRIITGSGVLAFAAFHVAVILVLVLLAIEAGRGSDTGRIGLAAAEALLALYFVGFLSSDWSAWFFGPGLCAGVVVCQNWKSISAALGLVPGAGPAPAAATPLAQAAGVLQPAHPAPDLASPTSAAPTAAIGHLDVEKPEPTGSAPSPAASAQVRRRGVGTVGGGGAATATPRAGAVNDAAPRGVD